ncbi:MAG: transposase [Lysobacterales bacterium]
MDYRRYYRAGALVFITLVTRGRAPILLAPNVLGALRRAVAQVSQKHPFRTLAYVILADHCHLLWRMPEEDGDFSLRVRLIKHFMARQSGLPRPIWQQRFWDHVIRDEQDLHRHLDYVHFNPVKHGHCPTAADWPHSSFRYYLGKQWYQPDWGAADSAEPARFGE